jgi:hypothetical protein
MLRKHIKFVALATVAMALSANAAFAIKAKVKQVPVPMPGVDGAGNLDFGLGAEGSAKLSLNTKTGRVAISARGKVENDSNHAQKYVDVGILTGIGDVIKDDYKVSKKGAAVYTGLSKNVPF